MAHSCQGCESKALSILLKISHHQNGSEYLALQDASHFICNGTDCGADVSLYTTLRLATYCLTQQIGHLLPWGELTFSTWEEHLRAWSTALSPCMVQQELLCGRVQSMVALLRQIGTADAYWIESCCKAARALGSNFGVEMVFI